MSKNSFSCFKTRRLLENVKLYATLLQNYVDCVTSGCFIDLKTLTVPLQLLFGLYTRKNDNFVFVCVFINCFVCYSIS